MNDQLIMQLTKCEGVEGNKSKFSGLLLLMKAYQSVGHNSNT